MPNPPSPRRPDWKPLRQTAKDDDNDGNMDMENDDPVARSSSSSSSSSREFPVALSHPYETRLVVVQEEDNETERTQELEEEEDHPDDECSQTHLHNSQQEDDDDDDDEYDESGGCFLPTTAVLLLPFILLTVALAVAYMGRRQDFLATELSHDNSLLDESDNEIMESPVVMESSSNNNNNNNNHNNHQAWEEAHAQTVNQSAWPVVKDDTTTTTDHTTTTTTTAGTTGGVAVGAVYHLTERAVQQIQNYRNGTGLFLNIELANQGANAICQGLGHAPNAPGPVPRQHCRSVSKEEKQQQHVGYPDYYPWNYDETAANIVQVRRWYHMISWRFAPPTTSSSTTNHTNGPTNNNNNNLLLPHTNWEHADLLSVLVIREPLDRLLAYDDGAASQFPAVFSSFHSSKSSMNNNNNNNHAALMETWWKFATSSFTDNFALRVLAGRPNNNNNNNHADNNNNKNNNNAKVTRQQLDRAKSMVERVSVVLDMACLDQGLVALADLLGLERPATLGTPKVRPTAQERIPTTELLQYLQKKNALDIELYQWAQSRSLVNCT